MGVDASYRPCRRLLEDAAPGLGVRRAAAPSVPTARRHGRVRVEPLVAEPYLHLGVLGN